MQTKVIKYQQGDRTFKSYMAFDENKSGAQPTVIIVHAFDGITDFIKDYAADVVNAGYNAFCIDMFGEGEIFHDIDGCMSAIMPMIEDRALLQRRVLAGFEACKQQAEVDEHKLAAMGFCFGGMVCLDLARAGADVKAVVSLHGVMMPPENVELGEFKAKALILHGFDDPQVPPDQLQVIADEFNSKNVDWQFVFFGHTKHAYTEPHAADIGGAAMGREHNADSAKRAFHYSLNLFAEVFA